MYILTVNHRRILHKEKIKMQNVHVTNTNRYAFQANDINLIDYPDNVRHDLMFDNRIHTTITGHQMKRIT